MAPTTVQLSEDLQPQITEVVNRLGFKNQEEFIEEAVRDKILEIKKKQFFAGSDLITQGLSKKKITEKQILEDFERQREWKFLLSWTPTRLFLHL